MAEQPTNPPTAPSDKKAPMAKQPKPTPPDPFAVIRRARDELGIRQVCVGTSCGKDSVATLALCIDYFGAENVYPFFMYIVPGLSFQEKYLAYLERLFNVTIKRMPHWVLSHLYRGSSFRHPTVAAESIPRVSIKDIESHIRRLSGITWFATGEKSIDSLERNAQIRKAGVNGINRQRKRIWPISFWNDGQVFSFLKQRQIALPADYSNPLAQRSFGGLWYRDVAWIRQRYPADWQKVKKQFPLIEAQILRYELRAKRAKEQEQQVSNGKEG